MILNLSYCLNVNKAGARNQPNFSSQAVRIYGSLVYMHCLLYNLESDFESVKTDM